MTIIPMIANYLKTTLTGTGDMPPPAFPVAKAAGAITGCTEMAAKYCGGSRKVTGDRMAWGTLGCVSIAVDVVAII